MARGILKMGEVVMKNLRLEELSDKVRSGIPIDFTEALEVIEYQEELRKTKKPSLWDKFINWFKS